MIRRLAKACANAATLVLVLPNLLSFFIRLDSSGQTAHSKAPPSCSHCYQASGGNIVDGRFFDTRSPAARRPQPLSLAPYSPRLPLVLVNTLTSDQGVISGGWTLATMR